MSLGISPAPGCLRETSNKVLERVSGAEHQLPMLFLWKGGPWRAVLSILLGVWLYEVYDWRHGK